MMYVIRLALVDDARNTRRRKIRYTALTDRPSRWVRLSVAALRVACCLIAFYGLDQYMRFDKWAVDD